jgi:hypothetical protein
MRVKVVSRGFDGMAIREEGEEFDVPEGTEITPLTEGGWYVACEPVKKVKADKDAEKTAAQNAAGLL